MSSELSFKVNGSIVHVKDHFMIQHNGPRKMSGIINAYSINSGTGKKRKISFIPLSNLDSAKLKLDLYDKMVKIVTPPGAAMIPEIFARVGVKNIKIKLSHGAGGYSRGNTVMTSVKHYNRFSLDHLLQKK